MCVKTRGKKTYKVRLRIGNVSYINDVITPCSALLLSFIAYLSVRLRLFQRRTNISANQAARKKNENVTAKEKQMVKIKKQKKMTSLNGCNNKIQVQSRGAQVFV